MKKKIGDRSSKPTVSCLPEPVLGHLVQVAGLHEMTMWRTRKKRGI